MLLNSKRRLRRLGCGLMLVVWFALLIIVPCGVITLVTQNEIVIRHSDFPDDELRIWLLPGPETRGIGLTNGSVVRLDSDRLCTVTDNRFLVWRGQAANTRNCACYERQGASYAATASGEDACKLIGK
jgi:hypothetical protein